MQLEYIQNLAWELEITLGAHHKYYNTLEGIIKDKNNHMAQIAIAIVCNDPEIQKAYFPINIDAEKQAIWCKHMLCGYECAPNETVLDVHRRSNVK